MTLEKKKFESANQIVGPIDRMIRGTIAFLVIVLSFTLPLTIFEFAAFCGVTIFFFFTALTRWDPFYAVVHLFWQNYKDNAAINGRF